MSADKRWRLVCYDIRDAARWRQVYRIVRGRGTRVQYSVYRCRLDQRAVEQMRWELAEVMAPEDALLIVDLCPACSRNVVARNYVEGWTEKPASFRLIGAEPAPDQASEHVVEKAPDDLAEPSESPRESGA